MGIFHWFGKDKSRSGLSDNLKLWVHNAMQEMVDCFGPPMNEIAVFDEHFFPATFANGTVTGEAILEDLCALLQLDHSTFHIEFVEAGLMDVVPFAVEGTLFESELEYTDTGFNIYLEDRLKKHPGRLIHRLTIECVTAKLMLDGFDYPYNDPKLKPYIFMAGCYFGFGILLTRHLMDKGQRVEGFNVKSWTFVPEVKVELLEYILAYHAWMTGGNLTSLMLNQLPEGMSQHVIKHLESMKDFEPLEQEADYKARKLWNESGISSRQNDFQLAIQQLNEALKLTSTPKLKSTFHNNIGYWNIFLENYETSLTHFKMAMEYNPSFAYPYDNMGYALLLLGQLEEGKAYLDQAERSLSNNRAYSAKNRAFYHFLKGEMGQAEMHFRDAFELGKQEVDFLEYHYAEYLFSVGKNEEGMDYLQLAVDKQEPIAVKRLQSLLKS